MILPYSLSKIRHFLYAFILMLVSLASSGQWISANISNKIVTSEKYLFYLHGGVVTVLGNNAINQSMPEWGPYEYLNILDSLRSRGFNVISENRKEGVDDSVYVKKISSQIDTLMNAGIRPQNILVVGASAGAAIAMLVSARLKISKIKYAIMGACWPDTYKRYLGMELYGSFLSIIESTDPHGTCMRIFSERRTLKNTKEIVLNTGLSHGFINKGYKEWINPIVEWYESN